MGCSFSGVAAPPPAASLPQPAPQESKQTDWARLGGQELEGPLRDGLVALVRADWLLQLAEEGGKLARRQELPPEAFVGIDELQAAGSAGIVWPQDGVKWEWLRIIVLSYPWLQPGHPDPYGENLCVIAKALKAYVQDSAHELRRGITAYRYVNGGKPYGVLIDFTAMFQKERTDEEDKKFKLALPALNRFYSHPNTVVLKATSFPEGYPVHPDHPYELPPGANTVEYAERGWCYAESAMSGLVKDSRKILDLGKLARKILDLGKLARTDTLVETISSTRSGREPPVSPGMFAEQLDHKTFTSKKDDFDRVAKLYADAFAERIGKATELDYSNLRWGVGGVRRLLEALQSNSGLLKLNLGGNALGTEGARTLLKALKRNSSLQTLDLWVNGIGSAEALEALPGNCGLQVLNLMENQVGAQGAHVLQQALRDNRSLQSLVLADNRVRGESAVALGQALRTNRSLLTLELARNTELSDEGACALGPALQGNGRIQKLDLAVCNVGDEGACALGKALEENGSLLALCLYYNRIGLEGTRALARALQHNRTLQKLDLGRNQVDPDGALALAEALHANASLTMLNLGDAMDASGAGGTKTFAAVARDRPSFQGPNRIGHAGARALGQALQRNGSLSKLNVSHDGVGKKGVGLLRQFAFTRATSGGHRVEIVAD